MKLYRLPLNKLYAWNAAYHGRQLYKDMGHGRLRKRANNFHWKQGLYGCNVCCIVPNNGISTPLGFMVNTEHVALEKRNFFHPTFSQWCFVSSQKRSDFMSWSHFERKSSSIKFGSLPFSNEKKCMWVNSVIMQNRWTEFCLIGFWTVCLQYMCVYLEILHL